MQATPAAVARALSRLVADEHDFVAVYIASHDSLLEQAVAVGLARRPAEWTSHLRAPQSMGGRLRCAAALPKEATVVVDVVPADSPQSHRASFFARLQLPLCRAPGWRSPADAVLSPHVYALLRLTVRTAARCEPMDLLRPTRSSRCSFCRSRALIYTQANPLCALCRSCLTNE